MAYRGEDLDLRTPQTWSASAADLAGGDLRGRTGYGVSRNGPIWVDETVLACTNHAYDVAMLNRAGEVRLEHLVHALTRIDAAAEVLEARGVRVAALRRDTASVIASEIPIGLPNGKGTPRRSEALEEVLRLAAAHAARRNSPASVEDLLHVMLDTETSLPGLGLLTRNVGRPAAFSEPILRAPYVAEPRESPEPARPRAAGNYYMSEPSPAPRLQRSEFHGSSTDTIQNTRLDALEQMVRAIGSDLAHERKGFSVLVQDLQRELAAQRDETSRLGGGLHDRLQSVDAVIERRLGELSRPWLQMHDRLQGLEHAMLNVRAQPPIDLSPVTDRLGALERAVHNVRPASAPDLGPVAERIGALERAVHSVRTAALPDLEPVIERMSALERAVQNARPVAAADIGPVNERIGSLERTMHALLSDARQQIETAITQRSAAQGALDVSPLLQRLDMIEEAVLSREAATREISDRLRRQEELLASERVVVKDGYDRLVAEVRAINGHIDSEGNETASAVLGSLTARLEGLAGVIENRHGDTARALEANTAAMSKLIERLSTLETVQRDDATRLGALVSKYEGDLGEVHQALVKLNSNQHTLAGSIDQWRQDTASTMSIMGSRMETVEREAAKPLALLEPMRQTLDRMHKVTVERVWRRNRFWYWLFGTDDWIATSWPTHATRIADDARMGKGSSRDATRVT